MVTDIVQIRPKSIIGHEDVYIKVFFRYNQLTVSKGYNATVTANTFYADYL